MKQEMMSLAVASAGPLCKLSAPRSRQISIPAYLSLDFYRPEALPDAQQRRQSTEGNMAGKHLAQMWYEEITVHGVDRRCAGRGAGASFSRRDVTRASMFERRRQPLDHVTVNGAVQPRQSTTSKSRCHQ